MHEKQHDQNRLGESDGDSGNYMDRTQWQIGKPDRGAKQNQQDRPHPKVGLRRDDIFAHAPVLFTR